MSSSYFRRAFRVALVIGAIVSIYLMISGVKIKAGDQMPAFAVYTADQVPVSSSEFIIGSQTFDRFNKKPLLIQFWAHWCHLCLGEIPGLKRLQDDYGTAINIVAIHEGMSAADIESVKRLIASYGINYRVYFDGGEIDNVFGTSSVPASYLIDKNGKVSELFLGVVDWNDPEIDALIKRLISGEGK